MTTRFAHPPTLVERLVGAQLVILGRVGALRESGTAEGFEEHRTVALFNVEVDDVLCGRPPDRVLLRVLSAPAGEHDEQDGIRWVVPVDPDVRLLMLLARDVAPNVPDGTYAPVDASVFVVEEGQVLVPEDALDRPTRERVRADDRGRVSLEALRRLADDVAAALRQQRHELRELLPEVYIDRLYPPVLEQPGTETSTPAAPSIGGSAGVPAELDR